jgi:hypothetical protein
MEAMEAFIERREQSRKDLEALIQSQKEELNELRNRDSCKKCSKKRKSPENENGTEKESKTQKTGVLIIDEPKDKLSDGDSSETEEENSSGDEQQSETLPTKRIMDEWAAKVLKGMSEEDSRKKPEPEETIEPQRQKKQDTYRQNGDHQPLVGKLSLSKSPSSSKKRGKLPEPATNILKKWLFENWFHPYPTGN